jgi:Ca2+-binding RTX toxin-like protein
MHRAMLLLAILVGLTVSHVPGQAIAGASCAYDPPTKTVTADVGATGSLSRDVAGAILANGSPCGAGTVSNTDAIVLVSAPSGHVTLDLAGGGFRPGATDEGDGSSEIEIDISFEPGSGSVHVLGTDGPDAISLTLSAGPGTERAYDLNADEAVHDLDVTFGAGPGIHPTIAGLGGDDTLHAGLGHDRLRFPVDVDGGDGDDSIGYLADGGSINGGDGADVLDESTASRAVRVSLGSTSDPGSVTIERFATASLVGVEHVVGGPSSDVIAGDAGRNRLRGGPGSDFISSWGGDDRIAGEDGEDVVRPGAGDDVVVGGVSPFADFVSFEGAPGPMTVDLAAHTAMGFGNDALRGIFIAVIGSSFDDVLLGDARTNILRGVGGNDRLVGRDGQDDLHGQRGNDVLLAGHGDDFLVGGKDGDRCEGGAGLHDRALSCETVNGVP